MQEVNKKNNKEANKSYEFLFEEPEKGNSEIVDDINELKEKYQDWYDLKEKLKEKYGEEFFNYSYMNDLIDHFMSDENQYNEKTILEEISYIPVVRTMINFADGNYSITTDDGKINFSAIEKFVDEISKNNEKSENMKDYLKDVSSKTERMHHCHSLSVNLAMLLEKEYGVHTTVVTGNTRYFVPNNKCLHSWNEININGQDFVFDSTMNVFMNKEGYYLLRHVDEKELMYKIKSSVVLEDFSKYKDFLDEIDLKSYLTCRDEVMRDVKKKDNLFKNKNEGEER